MKRIILIVLAICILGVGIFVLKKYVFVSEEERIKKTLKLAEASLEKKDTSTFMKQISLEYRDSFGFTYGTLFFFVKDTLKQYEKVNISLSQMTIKREGKEAEVKFIGKGEAVDSFGKTVKEMDRFILRMKKESGKWKIVWLAGDKYSFE